MQTLSHAEFQRCIHPRQHLRFALALICAFMLLPFMLIIAIGGSFMLIFPFLILLFWMACETSYVYLMANTVMVSDINYPRINKIVLDVKAAMNVTKPITVFVFEMDSFNAFLSRFFLRRAIFLTSEMLENGVTDEEVAWIVGRFIGYWRVQQEYSLWGFLIRQAQKTGILNFFLLPFERASVFTGDRLGLAAIEGDVTTAVSAMQKLVVGRQLGYSVNPVGIAEQHRRIKGSVFAFFARLGLSFPHATARYVDLISFARRAYPEKFRQFAAANPGLPSDLDDLNSERYRTGSVFAAVGVVFGTCLLGFIVYLVAIGIVVGMIYSISQAFSY